MEKYIELGKIIGPQGPAGVDGQDGKSAYQSAVEAGYSGTETAFNAALSKVPGHLANKENPHGVTKAQVGLGSVDNTSDANKPVSTAQATAIADAVMNHNTSISAHADIRQALGGKASTEYVDNAIQTAIGNAIGGGY